MKVRPHGCHKWVNSHPIGTDVGKMGSHGQINTRS